MNFWNTYKTIFMPAYSETIQLFYIIPRIEFVPFTILCVAERPRMQMSLIE